MEQCEERLAVSANSLPRSQYCIFIITSILLYINKHITPVVCARVCAIYEETKQSRGFLAGTFKPCGTAPQQKLEHDAEYFCSGPTEQLLGAK